MKVHEGKKIINEDIKTNVEEKTTEVNTDEDGKKHTIYSDYNKVCILRFRFRIRKPSTRRCGSNQLK